MSREQDEKYMRRAIALAKAGEGWVHPNPMVGAVIVKDDRIIGEGYHRKCGELHAERNAIAALTEPAEGATIYVTLEPCCHYGKTPPCTEAIMENGIRRVVIGSRDPNPLVAGKGARILREAGIRVEEDFLREECDALNPVFFHYITEKTPYVVMKYAMTADGKIATKTGASKWITGEKAREEVQRMRHACMGIMAGIGTVIADDPLLNCRMKAAHGVKAQENETVRHPIRIICDSHLRIPLNSRICRTADRYETIVACGELTAEHTEEIVGGRAGESAGRQAGETTARRIESAGRRTEKMTEGRAKELSSRPTAAKAEQLRQLGIEVLPVPDDSGRVDLRKLMEILGARGIDSVLLEGGGELNESALRAGIVNEVRGFIAPKIFGGTAKSPVQGIGVEIPDQAVKMRLTEMRSFGDDLMLRWKIER